MVMAARRAAPNAPARAVRCKPGQVAAREIRKYQKTTDLLIPKLPFATLVREICKDEGQSDKRWQPAALLALQDYSEQLLTQVLSDAYECAAHAKRKTLMRQDFFLALRLTGRDSGLLDLLAMAQGESRRKA